MKFSACVEVLYPNLPFEQRIAAAKKDGLSAVEFWSFAGKNLTSIKTICQQQDIPIVACCVSTNNSDYAKQFAEIGLIDEASPALFSEMCKESLEIAVNYGIDNLIVCSGQDHIEHDTAYKDHYLTQSLICASEIFKDSPVTLVVEPLNLFNHPGTYLSRTDHTERILINVNSPKVKMLFDIYHQQMSEGNLTTNIKRMLPTMIGHFHCADVPCRHELGTGEINWDYLFSEIKKAGYDGYFGLEYLPTKDTSDGLPKQFF